MNLYSTSI